MQPFQSKLLHMGFDYFLMNQRRKVISLGQQSTVSHLNLNNLLHKNNFQKRIQNYIKLQNI